MAAGRAGSLAPIWRWGAVIVGTAATVAGWGWAALLVGWFVASSALTRLGHAQKLTRTAGVLGGLADSALGATVQARRWCATCARETERDMHDCGTRTTHARGLRWITNDTVNLLATLVGALAALAFGGLLFP
jgi:uncharacterized membrane protein